MFSMHARAPEFDYLRAVAFVRMKTKLPLTIIPNIRRREPASLQPIGSDDFALRDIFNDQVIADLVEWIDVKPCEMRFRQAFVELEIENLKPQPLGAPYVPRVSRQACDVLRLCRFRRWLSSQFC